METFRLDFVGVGPQRTGTTWLHQLLQHHPALCFPKDVKETKFFNCHYAKGLAWYTAHFIHRTGNQLCGEIGPTYFDAEVVPARVRQLYPECRIIINLRNPVDRALSLYRHHITRGHANGSFSEAVIQAPRIVDSGRYALHIPRWLDTFSVDQVTFVLLDDIALHPETVLKSIYDFLGIAEIAMPSIGHEKIGAPTMPRFRWLAKITVQLANKMHAERLHKVVELGKALRLNKLVLTGGKDLPGLTKSERFQLLAEYEADITFLENLLDRDLSAWREIS